MWFFFFLDFRCSVYKWAPRKCYIEPLDRRTDFQTHPPAPSYDSATTPNKVHSCAKHGVATELSRTDGILRGGRRTTGFLRHHLRSASCLGTTASFRLRRARCATSENLYHPPDSPPPFASCARPRSEIQPPLDTSNE